MQIDDATCYRALAARDSRFDGLFFVGVTSTGIYCRPICPARTPMERHCRFFANAPLAEREGFRPCLRCRPERAPGYAPVDAVGRTARAAAARIEAGALNDGGGLDALARDLGLGARQLRRVVRQEFGVSPIELAQTRRLLLAKQLIAESGLPITQVAFASGFSSVRRFNALFRSHYGLTPTSMRRSPPKGVASGEIRLTLGFRPPLAWGSLLRFFDSHSTAGVDRVAGNSYRRTVALGPHRGWFSAAPVPGRDLVAVEVSTSLLPALPTVLARVRGLFDLDARPDAIAAHLRGDPRLGNFPAGLRIPGAFDGFELAVRTILGQRISVRAATALAGRLSGAFGEPLATPDPALDRTFPSPERLAAAPLAGLAAAGIGGPHARAIVGVARAVAEGEIDLGPGPDPEAIVAKLKEIPGIGEWTAQSVAMRGLLWPDAFPDGDLALLRASGEPSHPALRAAADSWRPWRAYAAMALWERLHPHPQPPEDGDGHDRVLLLPRQPLGRPAADLRR